MPNVRNSPSLSRPPVEAEVMSGTGTKSGSSGAHRVGTYSGPATLPSASSGQGSKEPPQIAAHKGTESNRLGQRATVNDFEQSDGEDRVEEDESDDSESEAEGRPPVVSSVRHPTGTLDKKKRRVTMLVQDPAGDEDGSVAYPRLRFQDGHNNYPSSRRVSALRAEYAVSDTQLMFRNDKDGNPTSTIIIYTYEGDDSFYDDDDKVIDIVEDKDKLVESVDNHPEAWFTAISKYIDVTDSLREDAKIFYDREEDYVKEIEELREATQACERNHSDLGQRVLDSESTIAKAREMVSRLRTERSDARRDNKSKTAKIKEQERTIALLQEALNEAQRSKKKSKKHLRSDFDPSDDSSSDDSANEGEHKIKRESRGVAGAYSQSGTPFAAFTPATADPNAHNPRYPDISDYHGKASEDLEQWTAAADTKFTRSWANFPTEWSKIEYLRDHCKDTAYSVVKLRALRRSENPYLTAEQLINDLELNFGMSNEDRKAAALQKLTSGDCKQKQNEGASEWLARYNLTATEAQLDQATRRFYALQNLNSSYKTSATQNARTGESWSEFCARLRQLEKDIAAAYGNGNSNGNNNKDKKKDGKSDKGGKSSRDNNYHRPKEQFKIIMEKKLCARCLKPGHIPSSPEAPCRDKKMATWDKALEIHAADTESQQDGGVALKE